MSEGIVRRPLASITAWPTKAANPMAISRVPTLNSAEDSWGSTSGDRGAAGLRPGARADRDRARDDLEDEAAVGAGVDDGGAAQVAHRADHRELLLAGVAAGRSRRVDERVASAVGQALGEDRQATGVELGDARAFLERDLDARLAGEVDHRAEQREGDERADDADEDEHRHDADQPAPVRHDEVRRDVEDRRPDAVERIDQAHVRIVAVEAVSRARTTAAPCAGCPS